MEIMSWGTHNGFRAGCISCSMTNSFVNVNVNVNVNLYSA